MSFRLLGKHASPHASLLKEVHALQARDTTAAKITTYSFHTGIVWEAIVDLLLISASAKSGLRR